MARINVLSLFVLKKENSRESYYLFAIHSMVVCNGVTDGVDSYMAHMEFPRGVGKHIKHIKHCE